MNEQPEALRLADALEDDLAGYDGLSLPRCCQGIADEAAAELRRLHAENEKLRAAMEQQEPVAWLHQCRKRPDLVEVSFRKFEPALVAKGYKSRPLIFGDVAHQMHKREPLTARQIQDIVISVCDKIYPQDDSSYSEADSVFYGAFVRAVEEAHGIK